jgi:acyl homoserine lactone synthase
MNVLTHTADGVSHEHLCSMFRLRCDVFHVALGWEVEIHNGMEFDRYDRLPKVVYITARSPAGEIVACCRLLPTTDSYMLKDTFAELLHDRPAPNSPDVWEISRFAVATEAGDWFGGSRSDLSLSVMRTAGRFAVDNGIARYVMATTLPMERRLRQLGLHAHRLGPSVRIGKVNSLALVLECDQQALAAVGLHSSLPLPNA